MDNISQLLSFIPDEQLAAFASDTDVNYYAKKLKGELLFKLLLYCLFTEKENSLRGMKSTLEDALFQALCTASPQMRHLLPLHTRPSVNGSMSSNQHSLSAYSAIVWISIKLR